MWKLDKQGICILDLVVNQCIGGNNSTGGLGEDQVTLVATTVGI